MMNLNSLNFLFILCSIFYCSISPLSAQSDYKKDKDFFLKQITVYQDWLAHNELAAYFEFKPNPLEVKKKKVSLYLTFRIKGIDASINGIRQINFLWMEQTGLSLEESLFQKALHVFELPPQDLIIRVRSIPDEEGIGVDSRLQYKKYKSTVIDEKTVGAFSYKISPFSTLRSEVKDTVVIHDFELPEHISFSCEAEMTKRQERLVCTYIENCAKKYFATKGDFQSSFPLATNTINFGVKNLKHEVIEPGVLKILDPHEKLSFIIKILPIDGGALRIVVRIDGKFGPGFYRPRSGDYHEMAPQYLRALETYTLRFIQNEIRTWIIQMPN